MLSNLKLQALNGKNGFTINGYQPNGESGGTLNKIGDINGDGIDDFAIGASGVLNFKGQSYVIFGSKVSFSPSFNLSGLNGKNGFAINGYQADGYSGCSLSGIQDINGDGIDDFAIGASGALNFKGQSYVIFGSRGFFGSSFNLSDLNGTNGFTINGYHTDESSGRSIGSAGDINGDGIKDIIIGTLDLEGSGKSYVIFGSKESFGSSFNLSDLNGINGFTINGFYNSELGFSVATAGDINGDGIDDIIIGAPHAAQSTGQSYVVFGSKIAFVSSLNISNLNGQNGFTINGYYVNGKSGYAVSSAGDINGDGIKDIMISAPVALENNTGQIYIMFGSKAPFSPSFNLSDLNGINGFTINGNQTSSGRAIAAAGDINRDGIDDIIIGAPEALSNNLGQSYIVFGSKSFDSVLNLGNLNGLNGFTINGYQTEGRNGEAVSGAGDINGDGIDDIIIGAPGALDHNFGQSYVIFGMANNNEVPYTSHALEIGLGIAGGIVGLSLLGIAGYCYYKHHHHGYPSVDGSELSLVQ